MRNTCITIVALLISIVGSSADNKLFGLCDFETNDRCGLSVDNGFEVEHGRPSFDFHAMESGYSGDGYLLLKDYNSENTISTPLLVHQQGTVLVHFAYYVNGNGETDSIKMSVQAEGEDPVTMWSSTFHDHDWNYVNVTLDTLAYESCQIMWTGFANKITWTQTHAYVGLDFIEVVEVGGLAECSDPDPVEHAKPWECYPPAHNEKYHSEVRETFPDGSVCTTTCLDGFTMQGQPILTCNNGVWDYNGNVYFLCEDTTPPQFIACPSDSEVETQFGWGSLWYNITQPDVSDNSGEWDVKLYVNGELQTGTTITVQLSIGNTTILYVATDSFLNEDTCSYIINVIPGDQEPPKVTQCPLSRIVETEVPMAVTWMDPVFTDNTGYIDRVESNYESGTIMAWGIHDVVYTAYDNSSNSATCAFTITVNGLPCSTLDRPVSGALVCHDSHAGKFCISMCGPEGDFQIPTPELSVPDDYLCSTSGDWYPYEFIYNCLEPYGVDPIMPAEYYFQGACNDTLTQDTMRLQALTIYNNANVDSTMGTNLTTDDFYIKCGAQELHKLV